MDRKNRILMCVLIGLMLITAMTTNSITSGDGYEDPLEGAIILGDMKITDDLYVEGDIYCDGTIHGYSPTSGEPIGDPPASYPASEIDSGTIVLGDLGVTGNATVDNNVVIHGDLLVEGTIFGNYSDGGGGSGGGDGGNFTLGNISFIEPYHYIIFRDTDGDYYAKSGYTGEIEFSGSDADVVIQQSIDALDDSVRGGGVVYLRKSEYLQWYEIPGKGTLVHVDYYIDSTISVPDGISIIADGVLLKVNALNDTVFECNPQGIGYFSQHLNPWGIRGVAFIGDGSNTNACAIHIKEWQHGFIVDNIYTEYMAYAVRVEGSAYRSVIQNSNFVNGAGRRGIIAVRFFKGSGSYPPNAATIINCDISAYGIGVQVDQGYGIRIANNYFENNDIAINLSGNMVTVIGNYIQPGYKDIGVYVGGGSPTITANTFLLGGNAKYAYGIYATKSSLVSSNIVITDSASNAFFYSEISVPATIIDNRVSLKPYVDSKFIDAKLSGAVVSGNKIGRGNPAIHQKNSPPVWDNKFSDNSFYASIVGIITGGKDEISNNQFHNCAVDVEVHGNYNVIKDNVFSPRTGQINKTSMGSGCIITGNIGYTTENSGTSTGGTTITVTHGLVDVPDVITITPRGATTYFYVASRNSVTFVIISESDVQFDWYANT